MRPSYQTALNLHILNISGKVHEKERSNWQLAGITDTERGINIFQKIFRVLAIFLFYYGILFFPFTKFLLKFFPGFLMISPYC